MTAPVRIQLSRKKGWRMPPNTVKVDRSTKWGNPFVIGECGIKNREEAVRLFAYLMAGNLCISLPKLPDGTWHTDRQQAYRKHVVRNRHHLRGKNLACWCPLDAPCHADVLLELANR
jgi:hypothetical protein